MKAGVYLMRENGHYSPATREELREMNYRRGTHILDINNPFHPTNRRIEESAAKLLDEANRK